MIAAQVAAMLESWSVLIGDTARLLTGGGGRADVLQDFIGARALVFGHNAYPILGPAFIGLGVDWPVTHASTHPPTAFLFLLPLVGLPWPVAAQLWSLAMVGCVAASASAFGLRARTVLVLAPVLLWAPVLSSVAQMTGIWLLCMSLAWHYRHRHTVAGALIGVAALTKLTPGLALVPFVQRRAWGAVRGFLLVWLFSLALLVALNRSAIGEYLNVGRDSSAETIFRADNGALVPWAFHANSWIGVVAAIGIAVMLLLFACRVLDVVSWHAWTWLTVAVLPIAWTYSLLPLLPGLVYALRYGRAITRAVALGVLGVPLLAPLPGDSPASVAFPIALAGEMVVLLAFYQRDGKPGCAGLTPAAASERAPNAVTRSTPMT